jgi:signal transduction histidine kinase
MTDSEGRRETTLRESTPHDAAVRRAWPVVAALTVGLIVLAVAAIANVRRAHGRPFPGLFVDPYGSFSVISWPAWGASPLPLRFPDRLVAVDGAPVPPAATRFDLPAHRIGARIAALAAAGRSSARVTFETHRGSVTLARPLLRLGVEEELFFFGLYALVGAFVLWSGLAVYVLARRRTGAVAYAWWSIGTFVFLVTFYDYHSTARLAPLFSLSTVCVQICVVWLCYSFPEPPARRRPVLRGAAVAFTVLGAGVALALVLGPPLGADVLGLRVAVGAAGPASMVALSVGVLARLRGSSARRRQELRSAMWGLVVVPALLAVGFLLIVLTGVGAVHLLLPFLAPLLPLSIGYSLIRHNILGTTAVLTRRMFVVPVLAGALVVALVVWLGLHLLLQSHAARTLIPGTAAAAVLATLGLVGYRLSGRLFFAATTRFRPTLQQLADDLASKSVAAEICTSIEEAVTRWLPTERALVVLPGELHRIPNRPPGFRALMTEGRSAWTTESHWQRQLLVPMRSQGGLRGVLVLAPKHESALYTREDLELLETISSLGAVALHNADVIGELEMLRRFEVGAARDDKRLALGLLGAEISHEIAYPLNFLRYLLREGDAGRSLETRDLEAGREEIGRLERMFAALNKFRIPAPRLEPVLVLPRVRRAVDLIREMLQESRIPVSVDIPPDLTVTADPDGLVQIFANLLRNAAQAVGPGAAIGARSRTEADGTVRLEVWDQGPGVPEELAGVLFSPFVTGKKGGTGLGLAVTQRLVRNFGWNIAIHRAGGETVFDIEIPPPRPLRFFDGLEAEAEPEAEVEAKP